MPTAMNIFTGRICHRPSKSVDNFSNMKGAYCATMLRMYAPEVNNDNLDQKWFENNIPQNVKYYRDIYTVVNWKYVQNNPCNIGKQVSTKMWCANADQKRSEQGD